MFLLNQITLKITNSSPPNMAFEVVWKDHPPIPPVHPSLVKRNTYSALTMLLNYHYSLMKFKLCIIQGIPKKVQNKKRYNFAIPEFLHEICIPDISFR